MDTATGWGCLPLLHPEEAIDAPRVDAESLVRLDVEGARARQVDREIVGHAGRAGGENDDAAPEEHGLADPVGDEDDGLAALLPDAEELQIHLLAGKCVERA